MCEQQEHALRATFEAQLRARAEQATAQPEPSCADVNVAALNALSWEQEQDDEASVMLLPCLRSAAPNTVLLDKNTKPLVQQPCLLRLSRTLLCVTTGREMVCFSGQLMLFSQHEDCTPSPRHHLD
jgi:hypothetical protein